jgi:hypothetical protein
MPEMAAPVKEDFMASFALIRQTLNSHASSHANFSVPICNLFVTVPSPHTLQCYRYEYFIDLPTVPPNRPNVDAPQRDGRCLAVELARRQR